MSRSVVPPAEPRVSGARARRSGRPAPVGWHRFTPLSWWRRRGRFFRRLVAASTLLLLFLLTAGSVVLYRAVQVPLPDRVNVGQETVVTYADGSELGRIGSTRVTIGLDQVPIDVQRAVLAAEDRNFYSEPGISVRGIGRATWANLRGGGVSQGGSTITQQYARNGFEGLSQDRTFSRKTKEIVIAIKLDREYPKNQILEFYLNTIYFGRGAYGIEAASRAYFATSVSSLSAEQGAVLAGLIRSPGPLDPRVNPEAAQRRWHQVLDAMVGEGWLDPVRAVPAAAPPATIPVAQGRRPAPTPQVAYLLDRVRAELSSQLSEDQINLGGLRVTTTIDRSAQQAATDAVDQALKGVDPLLQTALVAVEPQTGAIRAWYGGRFYGPVADANGAPLLAPDGSPVNDYLDTVSSSAVQPGSTFKPVVLATALAEGIPLSARYNGNNGAVLPGYETPDPVTGKVGVQNFEPGRNPGQISLATATAQSVNSVFVALGQDVGIPAVIDQAHRLGIPDSTDLPDVPSLPLGTGEVRPLDMAEVYATFAAGGTHTAAHLVEQATDSSGSVVYGAAQSAQQVLSPAVAADVTRALAGVVSGGTGSKARLSGGRPAAGKTGTTTSNRATWFCGYTPQLATAVALFYDTPKPLNAAFPKLGAEATGGSVAAPLWKAFTDAALAGQPVQQFPTVAGVGGTGTRPSTAPPPTTVSPTPVPVPATTEPGPTEPAGPATTTPGTTPPTGGSRPPTTSPGPVPTVTPSPSREPPPPSPSPPPSPPTSQLPTAAPTPPGQGSAPVVQGGEGAVQAPMRRR